MVVAVHRTTYVRIDLDAIQANIAQLTQHIRPEKQVYAVVKAEAYGHGAVAVARAALAAGVTGFCVAVLDEALALRAAGITQPILVMGLIEAHDALLAAQQCISVTVTTKEWLEEAGLLLQQATQQHPPLCIHLKYDSGMSRIGFVTATELAAAAHFVLAHPQLLFEGVLTHFATADGEDDAFVLTQYERFQQAVAHLPQRPTYVHLSNTAMAMWHEVCDSDIVRLGIGMYGVNPSDGHVPEPYALQPALSWHAAIAHVKLLPAGATVGYGATYRAQQDEWVATVQVGYADGWSRLLRHQPVLVDGQRCEILGNVCMDQLMIRLPKQYPIGTEVTLIGRNGQEELSVSEVAATMHTIGYEILCGISSRVPRVYVSTDGGGSDSA